MRYSKVLSAVTIAGTVSSVVADANAPAASVITDNAPGAYALCNMPGHGSNGIFAEIVASTSSDGRGVEMTLNINGGDSRTGGPFMYHIHEKAVTSDTDCASAGAHLDPTKRGEDPPCDPTKPETCQVGDLSGKHETCDSMPGCSKSFRDAFLSLTPGNPAYIGDKSFVIHYANKTRIACANFSMGNKALDPGSSTTSSTAPSATPSPSGSGSSDTEPSSAQPPASNGGSRTSPSPTPSGAASALHATTGLTSLILAAFGLALW